jgi:hypothetical protein
MGRTDRFNAIVIRGLAEEVDRNHSDRPQVAILG